MIVDSGLLFWATLYSTSVLQTSDSDAQYAYSVTLCSILQPLQEPVAELR